MAYNRRDDDLAYGDYNPGNEGREGDRGFVGDMGRRLFGNRKEVSTLPTNAMRSLYTPGPLVGVSSGLEADRGSHSAVRAVLLSRLGDLLLPSSTSAARDLLFYLELEQVGVL